MDAQADAQSSAQAQGPTSRPPLVPGSARRTVQEVPGDLFDAPEGSALIHACNTQGSWGAGIARTFKHRYPAAYRFYRDHCRHYAQSREMHDIEDIYAHDTDTATVRMPLGTALIIPPQAADARPRRKKHWIVCLFTSKGYGQHVDRSEQIINSTLAALEDLKEKLADLRLDGTEPSPTALYSCRFNSGLFAVPWSQTRAAIEQVGLEMTVMTLPGGNDDQE